MLPFKEVVQVKQIARDTRCILVSDIGGTNSNFGVFTLEGQKAQLQVSLHFKSQQVQNFTDLIVDVLNYLHDTYGISISRACFAAAGVTSEGRDYCKPTNLSFAIDAQDIIKKTSIECAYLVNDFEVIGYGVDSLAPDQLVTIHEGVPRKTANRAVLGAGTGLGKCILAWEKHSHRHVPLASEGGHADFAAQDQLELDLIQFTQDIEQRSCRISWEDVLSGNGIKRMYAFFKARNSEAVGSDYLSANGMHPDEIFKNRALDLHAQRTFDLYIRLYARCAKNFALDALSLGGIYIAGGIAAHNVEMFKVPIFMQEFVNCGKQEALLNEMPVYIIADYNVSLYGTMQYMLLEGLCTI